MAASGPKPGDSRLGAAGREAVMALRHERIGIFAEALADGHTIGGACVAAGVSKATGTAYMAEIRADLGWQAR